MDKLAQTISARMSLRKPQKAALEILSEIVSQAQFKKEPELAEFLNLVKKAYPGQGFEDVEREFPSLCFQIATGVGKTRLMGAFITYLFLTGKSRHFFVLAPNLTIYNKLKADFEPGSPKYVFKGISEFVSSQPVLITGENWETGRGVRPELVSEDAKLQLKLFDVDDGPHINIFNISKINLDGKTSRIKEVKESIGESYFQYLSSLDDLVVIMDEAHRYRAEQGTKAINDLKPVLGLELTATAQTQSAGRAVPFKNIIYSYPLAAALNDGFVKEPAVATSENFKVTDYQPDQLELVKLQDGIHNHEFAKVQLEIYARESGEPRVKPFMLVVASDTDHAKKLRELIESKVFFDGRYAGKVVEIHSKQSKEEEDENIEKLLVVEKSNDPTEIVIHVDKLKEGWDVTNLYTIVPLRAFSSKTLVEQSIGRGLRLPYGKRVGVAAVDRLTIIAHDRFKEIIDHANDPNSIIRTGIIIGKDVPISTTPPIIAPPLVEQLLTLSMESEEAKALFPSVNFNNNADREVAKTTLDVIRDFEWVASSKNLSDTDIKERITKEVKARVNPSQLQIAGTAYQPDFGKVVDAVIAVFRELTIDVPNIVLIPKRDTNFWFDDFDLDAAGINFQPQGDDIVIHHLRTNLRETLARGGAVATEARVEDYIISALIEHEQISYDEHCELLYKLAGQAVAKLKSYLKDEEELLNVLQNRSRAIAELIFAQMMEHYHQTDCEYEVRVTKGFTTLKENAFERDGGIKNFREPLKDKSSIKSIVFTGFTKCCYQWQKFHSNPEREFAMILEDNRNKVSRWMKPAPRVFRIEWSANEWYEPDFVVETEKRKYLVETKDAREMEDKVVRQKARAAIRWCEHATQHETTNGGKPWSYVLIPDDRVTLSATFEKLAEEFTLTSID